MALSIRLRTARPADAAALEVIERGSFPDPSWSAPDFLKYDCAVAEIDSVVAGFLVSRQTFKGTAETPPEREILNLAVAVEFRRQGVATELLKNELLRRTTLFLEVRQSNTAAIHLYKNAGFTQISLRPDYYDMPSESAIVMRLKW